MVSKIDSLTEISLFCFINGHIVSIKIFFN